MHEKCRVRKPYTRVEQKTVVASYFDCEGQRASLWTVTFLGVRDNNEPFSLNKIQFKLWFVNTDITLLKHTYAPRDH